MNAIKDDLEIEMDYLPTQQYCKQAEFNNRVIKQRVRAAYHSLPYKNIPIVMIKYLAIESTKNEFLSCEVSTIVYELDQENLDYNKHCSIPFGSYIQTHI